MVTLLFADIEGSTRLLHSLGQGYGPVLARVRELVREVASSRDGRVVDWAGDGVFLAFPFARDAVMAAAELQRAVAEEAWPQNTAVLFRIGIHAGEPQVEKDGYIGLDVHIAARICAAGHGGQVVISRAARDIVGGDPPAEISFRPLGSHRLKDVQKPEQLFQLVGPGMPETFPPLRTMGGATLPALHHRLVGRRQDLTTTLSLLSRPDVRLVTITGPGGAGKSRLALEAVATAAVERPVHLVGLASISDPALVPAAIARTLGVRESAGVSVTQSVADALAGTRTLLLLDNFEHLSFAAREVSAMLDRVSDLDVLVTSRTPLRLSGEHVLQLEPLSIDDAATLFVELAAARGVELTEQWLPTVREICWRLDGLPLAIELVVAPLAVLPPAQLLQALGEGLALEMEAPIDLPERQRTLRTTIDWSYGLLSTEQRELHGMLAVFPGGAPLESLEVVCDDITADLLGDLTTLVEGGLVRRETATTSELRFTMLATVREYALETLAAQGRLDRMQLAHLSYFLDLAQRAEIGFEGDEQSGWFDRIEQDLDNVRGALSFSFESGNVEPGLRIAAALSRFWRAHGHVSEARFWLARGLAHKNGVPTEVRARALWAAERQAMAQSATDEAEELVEAALPLFRELGLEREEVFALSELAWIALDRDRYKAEELSEEALARARQLGDPRAISGALNVLGSVSAACGDHERAVAANQEALALRRTLGDPLLIADSTYNLGVAAFKAGDLARTRQAFEESHALAHALGDVLHAAHSLCMLGELDLIEGDTTQASKRIRESLSIYIDLEHDRDCAECLLALGGVAAANEASEDAARLFGAAEALRGETPLTTSEQAVLEQFQPGLEAALGTARLAELKAEGAVLQLQAVVDVATAVQSS
jgi:predicted ATPase/class 3 adenylate cyclase